MEGGGTQPLSANNKSFVELMKSEIVKYDMELSDFNDPGIRWDYFKYRMRQFAQIYSVDKARECREKRNVLEQKVKELESLILKKFIIILLRVSF